MSHKIKILISCLIILFVSVIFFLLYFNYLSDSKATYHDDFYLFSSSKLRKSDWQSGQSEKLFWLPRNVKTSKGQLILTVNNDNGRLTAGEVFTYKPFGYGRYEVRMMPIKNPGIISAFFNYANENGVGTEIDIEFLGYDTTKVQFNYYTNNVGGHEYLYDLGFDASADYHTYAFDWTKDGIYWYVDDKLVYEAHDDIPELEAKIGLDAWPSEDEVWAGKYDGKAPLSAYYDWISYTRLEDVNSER